MGGPTHNAPLGAGSNRPGIDPGTLARTQHAPPSPVGVRVAQAEPGKAAPILASFDIENAVIWVNEALLDAMASSRAGGRRLSDDDVETLVHEFAHVLQYREIFERLTDREQRAAAMVERRAEIIMASTEEEYVKRVLAREKQAEKLAQRIRVEILAHFDRRRGGGGFSGEEIGFLAEEKATQWIKGLRRDYERKARREWRKIRAKAEEHGGAQGVAAASGRKQKTRQQLLPVAKITGLFPRTQSPTLEKLLDLMVRYGILIVVSLSQEAATAQ